MKFISKILARFFAYTAILCYLMLSGCGEKQNISDQVLKQKLQKCQELYDITTNRVQISDRAFEEKLHPVLTECNKVALSGNAEFQYWTGMLAKEAAKYGHNNHNIDQALFWLYLSNENGYRDAKKELNKLLKVSNRKQIGGLYTSVANTYVHSLEKLNLKEPDYKTSWELEKKASSYGNIPSYSSLAVTYAEGRYGSLRIPKNLPESYKWFFLSKNGYGTYHDGHGLDIEQDKDLSKKAAMSVKSIMNNNQIEETKLLTKKWIKQNSDLVPNMSNALQEIEKL